MSESADVTAACRWGPPDEEHLPLLRCACGRDYEPWTLTISVSPEFAEPMPCCGRLLYFTQTIQIREVVE